MMGRTYRGRFSGSPGADRSPWMISEAIAVPWLRDETA